VFKLQVHVSPLGFTARVRSTGEANRPVAVTLCYSRCAGAPPQGAPTPRPTGRRAMNLSYPPTVIVRHSHENPRKCSVLPLRGRPDLIFLGHPVSKRPNLAGYVRLSAEGPPLSGADAGAGLL